MLAVLVLGVGLIACGGGDDEDSGSSDATSTPAAGGTSGSATAGAATSTTTGSSSGSGSGTTVGTEKGNQIANAAMLVVADLPGTGWSVTATDDFEGSLLDAEDNELTNIPACSGYVKKVTDAAKKAREARVGRASRNFDQQGVFGTSIDVEVAVYKDSKTPSTLISEAKGAFGSTDFENCFREVIKGSGGEIPAEAKFELKTGKPLASVPHSGVAQAYDITLSLAGVSFSMHTELYAWADKNATAFVTIIGSPDEIKADVVKAAVTKTDEKLTKAQ